MVVPQIDNPKEDLSDLLFAPKEAGTPQVFFSGAANTDSGALAPYFVGPIQVTSDGVNHGLGVIASRDVEAGECLFVIQPAVSVDVPSVFQEWNARYSSDGANDNATHNNDDKSTPQTLLERICEEVLVKAMREKLQSEDEQDRAVAQSFLLQLTEGEDSEEARKIAIPESQAAQMAALLGMSTDVPPVSTFSDAAMTDDKLLEIIRRNAFGPDFTMYEAVEAQWKERRNLSTTENDTVTSPSRLLGLYPLAAMLNHSCVPNALRVFAAGKWMSVHASSNIAKGSEIVWSYLPPILPYPQRKQQLQERHGFVCHCVRCDKEREAASSSDIFLVPQTLRAFQKAGSLSSLHTSPESRLQFTKDLLDWESHTFVTTASPKSNEVKRYWKIGNANLYIHYLNVVLMDLSNRTPEEADKVRANALMAAMELHFCFVTCHYACTEHLSVMHLCYELVAIMHSRAADPAKTLPKVKFWTEQLKRAHLIRYGPLGNNVNRVRMIMKHTQLVLRNKNGLDQVAYDFI